MSLEIVEYDWLRSDLAGLYWKFDQMEHVEAGFDETIGHKVLEFHQNKEEQAEFGCFEHGDGKGGVVCGFGARFGVSVCPGEGFGGSCIWDRQWC